MRETDSGRRYNRKQKGAAAEEAAVFYLTTHGYVIVERNWRCRSGELDIIAAFGNRLVFVEVRSRSGSPQQGTPEESVDARKVHQVRSTAQVYLYGKGLGEREISFDVVSIMLNRDLSIAALNHIQDAF